MAGCGCGQDEPPSPTASTKASAVSRDCAPRPRHASAQSAPKRWRETLVVSRLLQSRDRRGRALGVSASDGRTGDMSRLNLGRPGLRWTAPGAQTRPSTLTRRPIPAAEGRSAYRSPDVKTGARMRPSNLDSADRAGYRRRPWPLQSPDGGRYRALTAAVSAASPSFASAKSIPVFGSE